MKDTDTKRAVAATLTTPLGALRVVASPRGLRRIDFRARQTGRDLSARARRGRTYLVQPSAPAARRAQVHLEAAVRQLREYFDGRRKTFDVPLDLEGTAHQQRVWNALLDIPFGRTISYGDLAKRLGSPRAARAVGRACSTNPVPVVVPCHRVVGGDGGLHGYDGGLWRKRILLDLERSPQR